ncbi:MAG: SDR family oxidoreductase [Pseudomonadota bacterium]
MKRLLIAGFGDLGRRLCSRVDPSRWEVHALRRSPAEPESAVVFHAADLTRRDTLKAVPTTFDAVIYQATPAERTPEAYRAIYLQGMENVLEHVNCEQLIMVSSTAVYGQNDGQWVDEDSMTEPERFNGRILLDAEALACQHGGQIVRFSGIYGPGRDMLIRRLRSGQAKCAASVVQWTNRIHADDAARVLAHVLEQRDLGPVICATDEAPSPRCEVLDWLAEQLDCPRPERVNDTQAGAGKRVSNARLKASGFEFTYPDYRSGYQGMLQ